jgi:DNA polymerase III sliding clamp (beta) subunit (PCNA family)
MIIKREKFLNGLEYTSPGLSTRGVVDQMNCFVFKNGYIWTYNDEVATRCKCPIKDLEGAIRADKLKEILHKVKDEKLDVSIRKSNLEFVGKSRKFKIKMEEEISLPVEDLDYPKKKGWKNLPADFSDAIKFVQGCASRDDSKSDLTCIHLHPEYVEAFDNYQLARYKMALPLKHEVCVKQVALRHIAEMTMTEFFETDNWIHFRDARKQIFSCRVYLTEYFDLTPIIKDAAGKKVKLPSGLVNDSEEAGVFSTDSQNPQENYVQVTLKDRMVYIESEGQYGEYIAWKKINYKGDKFQFRILPKILADLVRRHSKCEISKKYIRVKTGCRTFVSALTLPKKKKKGKKK